MREFSLIERLEDLRHRLRPPMYATGGPELIDETIQTLKKLAEGMTAAQEETADYIARVAELEQENAKLRALLGHGDYLVSF